MPSVGYNFLCGRPHGADPLLPSAGVHLSLTSIPLRVDVINGWPIGAYDVKLILIDAFEFADVARRFKYNVFVGPPCHKGCAAQFLITEIISARDAEMRGLRFRSFTRSLMAQR